MDWLKGILNFLPLEQLSDILGEIVIWWSQMVKNVPPADLPMYAYLGGNGHRLAIMDFGCTRFCQSHLVV